MRTFFYPVTFMVLPLMLLGCPSDPASTNNPNNMSTNNTTNNTKMDMESNNSDQGMMNTNNDQGMMNTNNDMSSSNNDQGMNTNNDMGMNTNDQGMNTNNDMGNACAITPSDQGPVAKCEDKGLSGCFANSDCGSDERCENLGGDGNAEVPCCVKGPRGCKKTGEACADELECEEGLCVAKNDGPMLCTKRCMMANECPTEVPECQPVLGLCVQGD